MRYLILLLCFATLSCQHSDGVKLGRIARLTGEKVRDAVPTTTPFGDLALDTSPAAKVRTRLKTDAFLVAWPIQVVEADDGLHLQGRVPTAEHSDLAYRLASQTVGVSAVINELTVNP